MLQPLAIAVIGGILASMLLSLVVTPPVHYYIAGDNTRFSHICENGQEEARR